MYTRKLQPVPNKLIVNGTPQFGSFSGAFSNFDIRGVERPFGNLPFPTAMTNTRIKGIMRFLLCDNIYLGEINLFYAGYFSFMETTLWNMKKNLKLAYRQVIPFHLLKLPQNFTNSVTACRMKRRYVRILIHRPENLLYTDFDYIASDIRPSCEGHFEMNLSSTEKAEMSTLIPYGIRQRCQASYQVKAPVRGWINIGSEYHKLQEEITSGFFSISKAYFPLRTKSCNLVGFGRIDDTVISFQVGDSISNNENEYNNNVLFVGNEVWPLPPVKITRPYGIAHEWVIQDTENMVDLVFTPVSDSFRYLSIFIIRTQYHTIQGVFHGMLMNGRGKKFTLKEFNGIAKKILLRG